MLWSLRYLLTGRDLERVPKLMGPALRTITTAALVETRVFEYLTFEVGHSGWRVSLTAGQNGMG